MNVNQVGPSTLQKVGRAQSGSQANRPAEQVGNTFKDALQTLDQSQAESDQLLEKLAAGENVDLHQVMIAAEQTDVNFRVAIAIRDRLVEAYREVTRMTV